MILFRLAFLLRVSLLSFAVTVNAHAQTALSLKVSEPRAFGYSVGDIVVRDVTVFASQPLRFDADSLPQIGRLSGALELSKAAWTKSAVADGQRYDFRFEYQIFTAPVDVKIIDLPAFTLLFEGTPQAQEARVDYWPVSVAPLAPAASSPRHGLGPLRPDVSSPLIDLTPAKLRLALFGVLMALVAGYLLHVYVGLPFLSRRNRPFSTAYREIRHLAASSSSERFRRAYQRVHKAINETAGRVVFAEGVDLFVGETPRFAPLRKEITKFFNQSQAEFFGNAKDSPASLDWLIAFCRQCRNVERGAA